MNLPEIVVTHTVEMQMRIWNANDLNEEKNEILEDDDVNYLANWIEWEKNAGIWNWNFVINKAINLYGKRNNTEGMTRGFYLRSFYVN